MVKIFKRKAQAQSETQLQENAITPDEMESQDSVSDIPLDEKTQKLIADNDIANSPETDAIPSVNANERDAGNSKKLKLAAAGVGGMMLVLVGVGASVGRYQEKKAEDKAIAAEQAAQEQKKMATGTGLDISKDQQEIANSNFQDLPPPAAMNQPLDGSTAKIDAMATSSMPPPAPAYVEPIEPVASPTPKPRYSNNDELVAGRDYSPPAPIVNSPTTATTQPSPIVNSSEPELAPTSVIEIPPPKGADSNVLVDVNAVKISATNTDNNEQRQGRLARSFTPTVLADGQAGRRGDTSLLLLKGTNIPCVLKTKIDSTYQGFTVCQISKDVYSSNGKTLLLERGSTVFGEQNTQIQQGQARVSVLWNRIETPKGTSINIDSPATGQLGEMGIGAKVNNHFFKRFGASIMLSIIQDGLAAATKRMEGNNQTTGDNNTTVSNTSNTVEGMAEKALGNTINMPPTAIVKQGTMINILVARDVDFTGVYKLKRNI